MKRRYYYKGTPLAKYCRENKINYRAVLSRMYNKMMSAEEAVDTLYKDRWIIKCEDGVPLIKKCKDLKEYCKIYRRMCSGMSFDEAKADVLKSDERNFYNGVPLSEYIKDNKEYNKIRQRLRRGVPMEIAIFGTRSEVYRFLRRKNEA